MPLIKGTTDIGAIYKGTTAIGEIYKGTTLLFSSGTWEDWYQEFIYNALIPTTINSKQVKNKARIDTIYGNSVVENQQYSHFISTTTTNGITLTNNNDGSFTLSGTASADTRFDWVAYGNNIPKDHIHLLKGLISGSSTTIFNNVSLVGDFYTSEKIVNIGISGGAYFNYNVIIKSGYAITSPITIRPQLIDLTQMFPFDTPTTLSDTRVQALLNRGYIAYNTGSIESVSVSEISSEPYNLFDGQLETGRWDSDGTNRPYATNAFRSKDFIKVIPNKSYVLDVSQLNISATQYGIFVMECPNEVIGANKSTRVESVGSSTTLTFTTKSTTKYIRFYCQYSTAVDIPSDAKIVFSVSSSRTGYAPYQSPQTISFKYQGSGVNTAHDTLEITSSAYVFTKNMSSVDLGSLVWSYQSDNARFVSDSLTGKLSSISSGSTIGSFICDKYLTIKYNDSVSADKVIYQYVTQQSYNRIMIKDSSLNGDTTQISGTLCYGLLTPQVISIPKGHLGIVDLGTLDWEYDSNRNCFRANLSTLKHLSESSFPNVYCVKYMAIAYQNNSGVDNIMFIYADNNAQRVFIRDTSFGTNATNFKTAMQVVYLFYETNTEVADPTNTIKIESGGTITTNSNVLPNIDFEVKCK